MLKYFCWICVCNSLILSKRYMICHSFWTSILFLTAAGCCIKLHIVHSIVFSRICLTNFYPHSFPSRKEEKNLSQGSFDNLKLSMEKQPHTCKKKSSTTMYSITIIGSVWVWMVKKEYQARFKFIVSGCQ